MISPQSGPIANYSRQQYIKVKEKEEAWKKYKDAVEEGKTAGSGGDATYIFVVNCCSVYYCKTIGVVGMI